MATHSSILDCEIPWTGEPGGLQSMKLQKSPTKLKQPNNKKEKSQPALSSLKSSTKTFSYLQENNFFPLSNNQVTKYFCKNNINIKPGLMKQPYWLSKGLK